MRIQFGTLLADIGIINLPNTFQTGKMRDKIDNWFSDVIQPFNKYSHHSSIVKVETNKIFLRDTSIISPYSILLFGGSINVLHQTGLVIIDGWLKLTAPAQTAVLFKELRLTLHSVLKELIRKPERATIENEVIRSIIHLLLEEDKPLK